MSIGSGSRWYNKINPATGEDERYWSVTTILDLGVPKPQLIEWAAKTTAIHAVDHLDVLGAMMRKAQPKSGPNAALSPEQWEEKKRDGAVSWLRGERMRSTDKAKITGGHVHDAIEAYKLRRPYPGVPFDARPWYDGFLLMLEEHAPRFLQTEVNVFHRTRRYAGRLDSIGVWPGLADYMAAHDQEVEDYFPKHCPQCRRVRMPKNTPKEVVEKQQHAEGCTAGPRTKFVWCDPDGPVLLGDYKTGKGPRRGGVYPEASLQEAAYARCELMAAPDGSEPPLPDIDGAIGVHLQPGWYEILPVAIGDDSFNTFLFAYEVARWQDHLHRNKIGKPIALGEGPVLCKWCESVKGQVAGTLVCVNPFCQAFGGGELIGELSAAVESYEGVTL